MFIRKLRVFSPLVILLLVTVQEPVFANTKHGQPGLYPSYKGLVMCGYQGWFRAPGDGRGEEWGHFGRDGKFNEDFCTIDFWPDVSEYKKTYKTSFTHADGSPAYVFSSYDKSTVDLHFKWMKEYGIDGVFMQRFFRVTRKRDLDKEMNVILRNALEASQKYKRAIAVMYDLSGLKIGEDCATVIQDWKELVDHMKITNQGENQTYLFHNGKPLVAIWGIGFPDRSYNIRDIGVDKLINFLKNDPVYGGCTVLVGVPTYFRDLNADCLPDPYLHKIIKSADIVLPWMVQRFSPLSHHEMWRYHDHIKADIAWCKKSKVDYVPIVYPGFSWYNLTSPRAKDPTEALSIAYSELGAIPRKKGIFYWSLIYTSIKAGAEMLYVAMFDEIDEGTAIFKCTNNPPIGDKVQFVDYEGMPTDHYLWLTGKAAEMLRGEMPMTIEMPKRESVGEK